ncbi:hypothetical protein HDU76_002010, partial [Blyttiomyces sp. JEL0837]
MPLVKKNIPAIEDYEIHPTRGFLPADPPPLRRLPECFEAWELVLDDLSRLLLANKLRERVHRLPPFDISRLSTLREWQRAYVVLTFIAQSYIWGKNEQPEEVVPAVLAVPWCQVCEHLDLRPIVSYAAVELYNFKLLDPSEPWDLSNLSILHTFSGGMDEAWFYLVSLAIESAGGLSVPAIVECLKAVESGDLAKLYRNLNVMAEGIDEINKILVRMYEKNDAHVFFNRVRPFFNGWEKCEDLPNGVLYESVQASARGVPNGFPSQSPLPPGTYGKYAGGSAGQSSLLHVLDVALGINHHPTRTHDLPTPSNANVPPPTSPTVAFSPSVQTHSGVPPSVTLSPSLQEPASPKSRSFNYIHEMRNYMPGAHRRFITAVAESYSIRGFVEYLQLQLQGDTADGSVDGYDFELQDEDREMAQKVVDMFNRCVDGMKAFRDKHIQMVSVYIIIQARKRQEVGYVGTPTGVQTDRIQQALLARGTGGTNLIPFLKQSRDETSSARV